ncbi:MAG: MATE family efflux transporter [Synergistaceae bacterium]|nr:MATE family efflux transporter [Synergistaceae bacterium]
MKLINKNNELDMLHGSLADKMLLFAMPLAASMILQQIFNSADIAVIGRFESAQALAAVGSNGPTINLFVNLFVGMALGSNVLAASLIGRGEKVKIGEVVNTSMSLALISGIILLIIGLATAVPLLIFMNTPSDVMDLAVLYLRLYFLGMPFIMIYNFGGAILRSKGDSKRPLFCLTIAGIVNVILNLIFVIVFKMGVAGVAIATVISNGVSAFMILKYLAGEREPFKFTFNSWLKSKIKLNHAHLIIILKIGLPAGFQGMLFSISNICIQQAINTFGAYASAGSAAAMGFDFLTFYFVNAFTQAAVTFTSQNYAAGNIARCKRVYNLSMLLSMGFTAIACIICYVFRYELISFFTNNQDALEHGVIRMIHAVAFIWMCNLYEITGGAMRGMGSSILPAVLILLGCCAFRLVWVYLLPFMWLGNFKMLMNIYPFSWIITSCMTLSAYFYVRNKAFKNL